MSETKEVETYEIPVEQFNAILMKNKENLNNLREKTLRLAEENYILKEKINILEKAMMKNKNIDIIYK